MKGLVTCLLSALVVGLCAASPSGKEFITSFMQNVAKDGRDTRFVVEVAAPPSSLGNTRVTVTAMGKVQVQEIEPGNSKTFQLPNSVEMKGSVTSQQAVLIQASQDVSVTSLNYKQYTADTSVVYPLQDLGTEYYIFTPPSYPSDGYKEFAITNHKEPNTVEITLQGGLQYMGEYHFRGTTLTVKLDPFQTVQFQSLDNLSGTRVVSHRPVAVSSGHTCVEKYTSCDHVYEQLLPVNSWGNDFIVAPIRYHNTLTSPYDNIYIQASQPTKIQVNGNVMPQTLQAGETFELRSYWPDAMYVKSDNPVQVLFEFNGGPGVPFNYADPFLMTILPTDQFSKSYILEGQGDFFNNIIVVAQNKDLHGVKIDSKPLAENVEWHKVDGTDFSWTEMQFSTGANFHQISHPDSTFGVYSFGVSLGNGYGAPAAGEVVGKMNDF